LFFSSRKVKTFRNRVDATPLIMTYEDKSVKIHPSSVNFRARSFDSKYMTYFLKQKSSSTYIFDITVLNVYPILFFGDKIERTQDENGKLVLIVGDHHKFPCDEPTAQLIMDLRSGFEHLLQKKVCEPSPTDWSSDSHEGNLLR
jgi:ATP-dependent RNA helicase DHX36